MKPDHYEENFTLRVLYPLFDLPTQTPNKGSDYNMMSTRSTIVTPYDLLPVCPEGTYKETLKDTSILIKFY